MAAAERRTGPVDPPARHPAEVGPASGAGPAGDVPTGGTTAPAAAAVGGAHPGDGGTLSGQRPGRPSGHLSRAVSGHGGRRRALRASGCGAGAPGGPCREQPCRPPASAAGPVVPGAADAGDPRHGDGTDDPGGARGGGGLRGPGADPAAADPRADGPQRGPGALAALAIAPAGAGGLAGPAGPAATRAGPGLAPAPAGPARGGSSEPRRDRKSVV